MGVSQPCCNISEYLGFPSNFIACKKEDSSASSECIYSEILENKEFASPSEPMSPPIPSTVLDLLFDSTAFSELEEKLDPMPLLVSENSSEPPMPARGLPDGSVYKGQWDAVGRKHGRGIEIRPDGTKYNGLFRDGLPHGFGRLVKPNLEAFQGEFFEGRVNGQGTYITVSGVKYQGEWKNDLQHGKGTEIQSDGLIYEGYFVEGRKQGLGTFKWPDGSYYQGDVLNNSLHGKGTYVWEGRKSYSGEWVEGKMQGHGTFEWADGRKYEGNFENDEKNGDGVMVFPDGKKYEGGWKDGLQHGEGRVSRVLNGQIVTKRGVWTYGTRKD